MDCKLVLMQLKSVLIQHCNTLEELEESNAEYIVDLIDYILTNTVILDSEVINQLMEEIAVTSIYENNPQLLSTLGALKQLKEDIEECWQKK